MQAMHALSGMSRPTILKGMRELRAGQSLGSAERVRHAGGGRKCLEVADPALTGALERLMEESTAGDPMSLLRWTHKSTARIATELARQGHPISDETVRRRLKELGYSLQANRKGYEGNSPATRDAQFQYLAPQVRQFLAVKAPVLSIDTKKKERVGESKNPGRTWRPQGHPRVVNVYDFPSLSAGTAIPYGAYDVQRNRGFVNVGMTHDTADHTTFHQDQSYFHINGNKACVMWVSPDPITPEMGPMQYVRGSHVWGPTYKPNIFVTRGYIYAADGAELPDIESQRERYDIVTYATRPGDMIVHHDKTLHGSGGNASDDQMRSTLSVRYCGDDVTYRFRPSAPPQPHHRHNLRDGDPVDSDQFSVVWHEQ